MQGLWRGLNRVLLTTWVRTGYCGAHVRMAPLPRARRLGVCGERENVIHVMLSLNLFLKIKFKGSDTRRRPIFSHPGSRKYCVFKSFKQITFSLLFVMIRLNKQGLKLPTDVFYF